MESLYLDHCATTPLHPEVLGVMMRYFANHFGNPGSVHGFGREAKRAVDGAREQVAGLLGACPEEIVFTSGGTEADNLAILGMAAAAPAGKRHLVVSAVEHPAVLNACRFLETKGYRVTVLPVDAHGLVDPLQAAEAITGETCLVSIIHGNNETGVLEPLAAICEVAHDRGVPVHTDAVQTVGKIPFDVQDVPVDCLSLGAHKLYGPKGVGALYIRRGTTVQPLSHGGGQERGIRSGTENVPGIVGLGQACEVALREMAFQMDFTRSLRDHLESALSERIPGVWIHAAAVHRLPHVTSMAFAGILAADLVEALDREGVAVSPGAACHAGLQQVSHVLAAMKIPEDMALGTVRFSLGRGNQPADLERLIGILPGLVAALREKKHRGGNE